MAKLTYDLAFFGAPTGIAAARLWLYVQNATGGEGLTLVAWDYALPAIDGVPCGMRSGGVPVGSGTLAASGTWSVELDPGYVLAALRGSPRTLTVVLGIAEGEGMLAAPGAAMLSAVNSVGSPVLLLTAACGAPVVLSAALRK